MSIETLVRNCEKDKRPKNPLYFPLQNASAYFLNMINPDSKNPKDSLNKDYKPVYPGLLLYQTYPKSENGSGIQLYLKDTDKKIKTKTEEDLLSYLERISYLTPLDERNDRDSKLTVIEEKNRKKLHIMLFNKREEERKSYLKRQEEEKKKKSKETEQYKQMVCKYLN